MSRKQNKASRPCRQCGQPTNRGMWLCPLCTPTRRTVEHHDKYVNKPKGAPND